jgi:transcriptional regulator with XRE-family HTH domain
MPVRTVLSSSYTGIDGTNPKRSVMNQDQIRRQELSNFLRTRRARISPAGAGLPAAQRRRTPGLRREEVAQLAGVSVTWYTWLEQRRPIRVSAGVLDSLARVLKLDPIERTQLFQLAARQPILHTRPRKEKVSPLIQRLVDQEHTYSVVILGRRWDLLGWNRVARAFFMDFETLPAGERNLVWLVFTNRAMRSLLADWPSRARDVLARFRADYGRQTGDPQFVELVERLKSVSPEFAEWWPHHDVLQQGEGRKYYNHPAVGRVVGEHITLSVSDNPELRLAIVAPTADPDSIAKFQEIVKSSETTPASACIQLGLISGAG